MGFFLYKGLKKPLVFYGLQDKYIYYAVSVVVVGFIFIAIISSFMGLIGTFLGFGIIGMGVWGVTYIQDKKGLYNKTKNHNELHIFPKQFKNRKLLKFQNEKE